MDQDELACLIALAGLPGLGPATLLRLCIETDPVDVWREVQAGRVLGVEVLSQAIRNPHRAEKAARLAQASQPVDPAEELRRHRSDGRRIRVWGCPGYPERLAEDPFPPVILFVEGDESTLGGPAVALVGTRNATRAGREMAADLGAGLARSGVNVVSGLALGIDGAAHAGALRVAAAGGADAADGPDPGRPIGVIASGLDIAYPRRHQQLHRDVSRRGVLVSETPLRRRPNAWRFPARNRIIAALADAVVIVESRSQGGSMLTAADALLRDRPVLAVPGHPTSAAAAGANDLIFDGATPVRDLEDILVAIGRGGTGVEVPTTIIDPGASAEHRSILTAIGTDPCSLDEVVDRSGLALDVVATALVQLEAKGTVIRAGSWFERSGPHRSATGQKRARR
ncbi:MAG: DNA-protecting protein DprA [Actinomycetota bacterium]|nr:DNA-protecting protein DprA [Actinomycetota bacterium]